MPSPALMSSLLEEIDSLTDGLIGGQLSPVEWHNAVAREIFAHHLAEYAAASGKDEREVLGEVKGIVGKQIDHLNGFTDQIEAGDYEDREDALRARAAMYAGSLKGSYWSGRTEGYDLPCVPGACEECYGSCRCDLRIEDDGIYWDCLEDPKSCNSCVERGNTWQPYKGDSTKNIRPEVAAMIEQSLEEHADI